MTFPITDTLLYIAADNNGKNFPTGLIAVILVVVFIIASVISGFVSFKVKLKKLRKQNNSENVSGDDQNES